MSDKVTQPIQRWGKLEESYEPESEASNTLNLLTEKTKIYDNKVIIYAGLQFEEEKKTLTEQTTDLLAKVGNKVADIASDQVTKAKNLNYAGMFGILKKASKFVYGTVSDLVAYAQQTKKEDDQNQPLQEQNTENINDNWEIVIKGSTPQEILDQLSASENSSEGLYKITRINNAIGLVDLQDNNKIIQLESSSTSFADFVQRQPSKIERKEFDLLQSSFFEIKGALAASIDPSTFEQIRLEQLQQIQNQQFNWDLIFKQSQGIELKEQNQGEEVQQFLPQPNNDQQDDNQIQGFVAQEKYKEFLKINLPSIQPILYNQNGNNDNGPSPPPNNDANLVSEMENIHTEPFIPKSNQYEQQLLAIKQQYNQANNQQQQTDNYYDQSQREDQMEMEPMLN